MSTADALTLASAALLQLGEAPIDSFDGGTTPQVVAKRTYQRVVDAMLGGHPWVFNRKVLALARLSAAPAAATGYSAAYQLPVLCFRIVRPFVDTLTVEDWGLTTGALLIDATVDQLVELEYHTRVDETLFSPQFTEALVLQLAAEMALPLTEDLNRADLLGKRAALELARARHTNATEKPAIRMATGRLQARMRR
jgi:hypothetical protein